MDLENKVKEYVAQLESNPYDLAPLGPLEDTFDNAEHGVEDLVNLLAARAPEVGSEDAAARLYLEAARVASTGLGDPDLGWELLAQSLEIGEDTLVSVEAYLFHFALQDESDQLQQFFADALEHDADEAYQSRLYQRMGCILEDFVGDLDQADTAYEYALTLDPHNKAALWSRRALAQKQQAWDRLAEVLIEEIELSDDPRRQSELSVMVGEIYRDHLDMLENAGEVFAFAYEQDPTNEAAVEALRQLGYEVEVPEESPVEEEGPQTMDLDEEMLIEEAEEAPPEIPGEEEQADPQTMELDGEMLIEEDPVDAPEIPGEATLDEASADAEPEDEVEDVEEFEGDDEAVAEEDLEEFEGDDEAVAEEEVEELEGDDEAIAEEEVEEFEGDDEAIAEEDVEEFEDDDEVVAEEDVEEAEEEESEEVAEEAEEADDIEEIEAADEVDEVEEQEDEETWHDRFEELLVTAAGQGEAEALETLVKAAKLQTRHPDDDSDAVELWRTALECALGSAFFDATHYFYGDGELWDNVVRMIDETSPDGGDALKASILLFKQEDIDGARELAEAGGIDEILEVLDDLDEAQKNWRKFQRALEQKHSDLDGEEKSLTVYLYMADLASALGEEKKEVDALRRLRQVEDPRVTNRLMMSYRRQEKWRMYADLLRQEAESIGDEDTAEKVDVLKELIRVYRKEMNQDRMAINVYKDILELAPDDLQAIDELVELYDEMNMSSDLINTLKQKAELVADDKKVEIYDEIARLFLDKFRNQAEAIKAYEKVLEIEPYHGDAIAFLKEMYEKRRDWENLIDVHKREIETFETDEEKAQGLKEVAQLATDRLRNPDVATELWLEVREVAPQDTDTLDALETLYEKKREYEPLAEILEQKIPLAEEADEQMKLYQKLGMLYSDRLDDSDRAIEAWQGALQLNPEDLKARKALERLFIDNQRWGELEDFYAAADEYSDLVRVLGTLTGRAQDEETQIELLLRSARIWREELDDTSRAERELERVLELDAENEAAAAQLEPIYREAEDYDRLQDALQIVLSHLEEGEDRKQYQLKLGRLRRDQFEDWAQAFDWFARAFQEAPGNFDVVEELEQAAAEAGQWPTLVGHYREALDQELETQQELELRLLLGRVLSEEVEELDEALAQFEAVLEVEEENLKALEAMEGIYRRSERWDDLMQVYRHRLELEEGVDARVGILQGMADIAEVEAGDAAVAIARYNEALELDPRNEKTLAELHRLYDAEKEYVDLAEVIRQEIDLIERRARLSARRRERRAVDAAQIVGGAVATEDDSVLGGDFSAGPDEGIDDVLADLHGEEGEASEEAEGAAELEAASEAEESVEVDEVESLEDVDLSARPNYQEEEVEALTKLRYELGKVCMEHLDELDEAVDALGLVLSWRPGHEEAREAVESLLEDSLYRVSATEILEPVYDVYGEWELLVDVLEIQAEAAEEEENARELYRRRGMLFVEEIGDGERAFESYGNVVRLEPSDEPGRDQLYRIAHELGLWDRFVELYEEVMPTIEDEDLQVEYLYTLAQVNGEYREEYDEARLNLEEILGLRSQEMRALDDLEELFIRTESWRDLLTVTDRKIELFDEDDQIEELRFRKAKIWEELLEDSQQAIAIYEEILEEDPENLKAYSHLDLIYEHEGMWHELASDLEAELELVDEEKKKDIKNRLAQVLEAHLQDAQRAVSLYEEVLEEDPENPMANQEMEALMHKDGAPRLRVSEIMEPLYADRGDADGLIDALEVQVDENYDSGERVALLHRIAVLHEEQRGDAASAFQTYARALRDDEEKQPSLEHLYRLAEAFDGHRELVEVFEKEAEEHPDPDVQRDMLRRAAEIYIEPLVELDQATDRLHAVLELFPADLETVRELEEIYRHTQNFAELVDILVRKAELVEEESEKKELFHQAGTLYEDILDSPQDAIEIYNRVLALDESDTHAIDRLEVLYTNLERWHDLLEVHRRKLELAEDDDSRKALFNEMGRIYQEHLEQPQDAIESYRQIQDLDPTDGSALEKLDELFQATEQWHELLEILERRLELSEDAADREALKYRIGKLWEEHLADGLKAVEIFEEILEQNPEHGASIWALEEMVERNENEAEAARVLQPLYQAKEQWENLVHIQRLLIEASHDPQRKLELYDEVATILEDRLGDPAEAFATYVEALQVDAGREQTLETLERLAADLDGWEVLIEQLDDRLVDITDFDAVSGLQLRIARIFEVELADAQSAIDRYRRVLEVEPGQETAILALDRLYQHEGQWEDLAEILKQRVFNTEDPEEALELRLRLGMLYQTALEDAGSAITSYQEVLHEDPENETAIDSLEQMFEEGQVVERIADILEPYYMERGQFEKVAASYMRRLELFEDPFQRFDMLMQTARLYLDELQDVDRALQAYGFALVERPDDEQVHAEIERLAESTMAWGVQAEIYADALESPHNDDDTLLGLWTRLAQVLDQKMEAYEDAEMAYLQALELAPDHQQGLQALDRIYAEQARWEDLAGVLERRIESTYDEFEVVELSYRLAQVFQNQLGNFEGAVQTYEEMLRIQPDHEMALQNLEQIHMALEAWEDLYDVLERRAQATHDPDEQAQFYARSAQIAEQMLERIEDAIDLWQRVTELRPQDRDALVELRRLYLEQERWHDLVSVLRREVELAMEPDDQLGLYESLGTIYGSYLDDQVQAQEAWWSALELDPEHLQALESLRELTRAQADYQRLAQILERLIAHAEIDQERQLVLWEELGEVQSNMLMDPDAAIEAWQNVLSLNPEHQKALDELEELFEQESRWEEEVNVLEMKAYGADLEQRIELYTRIADIWQTRLFDFDKAAEYYRVVLEDEELSLDHPAYMDTSRALETIYREQGTEESFAQLASLYLDRAEVVDDVFERVTNLRDSARIFEEHLGQPENALVVLMSAVQAETADHEDLLLELERLGRQTQLWQEPVEHLETLAEELGETPEAASLFRRVGTWFAQELDQPDEAAYYLQRARMIEPHDQAVLATLEELYRSLASWPELAQVLETRVDLSTDPDEQVELWRKLGELYEMQLGEVDQAIDAYQEILSVEPTDILAMESLERVYEAFGRWEELVEILEKKAESTYDPDMIVDIKSRAARIWEEELGNPNEAILAQQDVLAVDQAHMPALAALERLYTQEENWNDLVEVYERQLSLTHEPAEQVSIYGKTASVYENQFQDLERAVDAYNNISMVEPDNVAALENLERLYQQLGRWFELVDILQRHIELEQDKDYKVELLAELGRIQHDEVGDPHAAIEAFEKAVELDPIKAGLWSELAALHEATNNWERAVEAYDRLVELLDDDEMRAEIYTRMGELLVGQLHDHASAEDAYHSALRLDPTNRAVLDAMRELLSMQQQWEGLIRVLKQAEDSERDLDAKAEYLAEVGSIYEQNIGDEVSALGYYEAALEHNPRLTAASIPLIEVAFREQRYERAVPLLEMTLQEYGHLEVSNEERHRRHLQLATAYGALAQPEEALQQYRKAYELNSSDLETLKGLGHLLYDQQEWDQASKVLQSLQLHHEDRMEMAELAEVFYRLGAIRQQLKDLRKAGEYYERALQVDQQHRPTLEGRVAVAEAQEKWEDVVHYMRWLLDSEEDPKVRYTKLSKLGDILGQKLGRFQDAVGAYVEALEVDPNSMNVLRKLLDLYTKTKQWHEAVGVLMRIIEQEGNASRVAKYYYTAAVIYRDEIEDPRKAVELFDKALDADAPNVLKAFEAIDRIWTKLKNWRELARSYRRMLKRISSREDGKLDGLEAQLWQNLGEVYRTRMGDFETAREAYKVAVQLDGENDKLRLILAELHEKMGDEPAGVIEQHRKLIELDRFRVESYEKLFDSYFKTKQYDRAWCMAGALSFLRNASQQQETFFRKYMGESLPAAQGKFNPEMLNKIRHPEEDPLITYIMNVLGQGLRPFYSYGSIKDWDVHKRKDKVDLQEPTMFNKVYGYVAQTINLLPPPEVYLKGGQPMGIRNANCDPPKVIIGGDVYQNTDDRELAFVISKTLTWMMPPHYIGSLAQPTEFLKYRFMAFMDMVDPSLGLGKQLGQQGQQIKEQIAQIPPTSLHEAQRVMKKFLQKGKSPNLSLWLRAVENTSIRMGLLLCGDIHTAASCIKSDMMPIGKASRKEKIREMVLFSISEEYFELREELGLAIGK